MKFLGFTAIALGFLILLPNKQMAEIGCCNVATKKLTAPYSDGGELFNKFCADCHAINEEVYGPALKDLEKRRDKKWIIRFVLNQEKLMQTDSAAAKMYRNSDELHTSFSSDLTTEQIKQILIFIEEESKK